MMVQYREIDRVCLVDADGNITPYWLWAYDHSAGVQRRVTRCADFLAPTEMLGRQRLSGLSCAASELVVLYYDEEDKQCG